MFQEYVDGGKLSSLKQTASLLPLKIKGLEDDPASLWVLDHFLIKLLVFREGTILQGGPLPVRLQVITLTRHLEGLVGRHLVAAKTNPPQNRCTETLPPSSNRKLCRSPETAKVTWKGQKSSFFFGGKGHPTLKKGNLYNGHIDLWGSCAHGE